MNSLPLAVELALNLIKKGTPVYFKCDSHTASPLDAATAVPHSMYENGAILFNYRTGQGSHSYSLDYDEVEREADLVQLGEHWTLIPTKRER